MHVRRPGLRRAGAAVGVLALLVCTALVIGTPTAPAQPRQAQQPSQGAVSTLADCSARTGRVAVTFLIDESASLRDTDPTNRRVEGVKAALTSLAQVADRTASTAVPVSVDVALLGFGVGTTEVIPWTRLDSGRLPDLLGASEQFAGRNSEIDTDYAAALLGARDEFARVPDPGKPACTAILWFTDGHYDIQARSTGETKPYAPDIALHTAADADALKQAGIQLLCQDGGVVDGLRGGGTQIFAVALSSDASPIAPEDQDFLRSVAEGQAGASRCGAVRAPDAPPAGAYLSTGDVSQLIGGFFNVVGELSGGTALPSGANLPVCPAQTCDAGTHRFTVDPGIVAVSMLTVTSAPGVQVELRTPEPGTDKVVIAPGDASGAPRLGSAAVRWTRVAEDAVLIDVTLPAEKGAWNGSWAVTFVDPTGQSPGATASASEFVFGDIEPFTNVTQFRAGEPNTISVELRHRDGSPVDQSLYASVEVSAVVVDTTTGGKQTLQLSAPDPSGVRTGTWQAPGPDFPAKVEVDVTAKATTSSGIALTAVTRSFSVDVLPPSAYPTLQPTQLRFATITGAKTQEAVINVRGGDTAAGCVWLESTQVAHAPQDAGDVTIDVEPPARDQSTCLQVDSLETRQLRVRITPSRTASGRVDGSLRFVLVSQANPAQLHLVVSFEAPLERALDTGKAFAIWIALMAVGLLIPIVFMWLLGVAAARFEPPAELKVARIDLVVTASDHVYRSGGPADGGIAIAPVEYGPVVAEGRAREFDVDGVHFRGRPPRAPFGAPRGEVAIDDGGAVGSVPPATVGRDAQAAPVPLGLAGAAIVLVPDEALETAPVALGATIAMALGQGLTPDEGSGEGPPETGGDSSFGRRPDLRVVLLAFAPADELDRYTRHFDQHRGAIATVVDSLYDQHRRTRGS